MRRNIIHIKEAEGGWKIQAKTRQKINWKQMLIKR